MVKSIEGEVRAGRAEFLGGELAGGDADGPDAVRFRGLDVVVVVADQAAVGAGGVAEGERDELGARGGHSGEGSELEVMAQAGLFNFAPSDAGEVAGDEAEPGAAAGEGFQEFGDAGADAVADIGAGAVVEVGGVLKDGWELAGLRLRALEAEHLLDQLVVEAAVGIDGVHRDGDTGDGFGGVFEGDAVLGSSLADEGSVDVEEYEDGGHRTTIRGRAGGESGMKYPRSGEARFALSLPLFQNILRRNCSK